jgi:hypothetical protein
MSCPRARARVLPKTMGLQMEMGSARALVPLLRDVPRRRGTFQSAATTHRLVSVLSLRPTGEGAGWNTRGRACSPKQPSRGFVGTHM